MMTNNVLIFFHHDVVSDQSNPRITSYISYLRKQGLNPCFRFVKSSVRKRTPYWRHYLHLTKSQKYKVAYFYSPNTFSVPMYMVCRLRGIRVVVEKTELDSIKPSEHWKDRFNRLLYALDEKLFPFFANALVVISKKLFDHYTNKVEKIGLIGAFIHHGHEIINIPDSDTTPPLKIGYLGSFGQKDDLRTLITTFQKLKATLTVEVELNLYGKSIGTETLSVEGIKQHGFLQRGEIVESLQQNNVLIAIRNKHNYSDYGFPSKLTEYFLTGRPIITSKSSDISLLFNHKEQVYLIDPEDENQLLSALQWCINESQEANAMGLRGKQWALAHWHSDVVLDKWAKIVLGV